MSPLKLETFTPETETTEKKWRHSITVARPLNEETIERLMTSGMNPAELLRIEKESAAEEFFFPQVTKVEVGTNFLDTIITFVARETADRQTVLASKKIGSYLVYLGFNQKEARHLISEAEKDLGANLDSHFFEQKFSELLTDRWNAYWSKRSRVDEDVNVHAQRTAQTDQIEKLMAQSLVEASNGRITGFEGADLINDYLDATDVIFKASARNKKGERVTKMLAGQLTFTENRDKFFYRGTPPIKIPIEDTELITFPEHLEYGEMPLVVLRGGREAVELIEAGLDNAGGFNTLEGQKLMDEATGRWRQDIDDQLAYKADRAKPGSLTAKKITTYQSLFSQRILN